MSELNQAGIEALAASLHSMLDRIRADELTASTATRYRLEGALTALEVVLGTRASLIDALTGDAPADGNELS